MIRLRQPGPDGRTRPVRVGTGALDDLPRLWNPHWRTAVLVGDRRVLRLHGSAVAQRLLACTPDVRGLHFPPGEKHKTRAVKERIEDALLAAPIDRATCLVALGGGVTSDLVGFVAATCLRGLPHLLLPTTLLAQIDAALGGKVGVDVPAGKNLVGAFRFPEAVLADPRFLATLPNRTWRAGLAELVKHGVVADASLFRTVERTAETLARPGAIEDRLLARAARVKLDTVARDPLETGERRILNFGHTLAHALEAATGHRIDHGHAVAVGMAVEAEVATALLGFPATHRDRLRALLGRLHLPVRSRVPFDRLRPFLAADKKNLAGAVRCALPERIGRMHPGGGTFTVEVPLDGLEQAWRSR